MNHNEKRGNLVSYILDQISKNKTREEITQSLKDSGWTDEEIKKGFLDIEEHKEKGRKKLWINLAATGFFVVFIVIILLTGPKSPVKYQQTQTIKAAGEAQTYSENIHDIIYDNVTGQRNDIPVPFAETLAKMKREEQERFNQSMTPPEKK